MSETINVPVSGFAIPPAPPGTSQRGQPTVPAAASAPASAQPQPHAHSGDPIEFVPAVPKVPTNLPQPGEGQPGPTLDPQIQAYLDAALASKEAAKAPKPKAPAVAPATAPDASGLPVNLNDLDVNSIENPQIKQLGNLLLTINPNLDVDRVFSKALEYGDAGLIDHAYLKEIGGAQAQQFSAIATQIVQIAAAETEANTKAVYATAGGEPEWRAAVAAFNKNAPKHLKTVAVQLLDSPNKSDILAGAKFVAEYARQGGFVAEQGERITANAGRLGEQGLSKAQLQDAIRGLKPFNEDPDRGRKEEALYNLRRIGKQRGL